MDNSKFLALMGDDNANFSIIVTKENLLAFAEQLLDMALLASSEKAARETQQKTMTRLSLRGRRHRHTSGYARPPSGSGQSPIAATYFQSGLVLK